MKKILTIFAILFTTGAFAKPGFYQTIDDETNTPKSIVAVYEYDGGKLGGRIIALYGDDGKISETLNSPVKTADKIKGKPFIAGLDIIWDMKKDGNEYGGGRIMDPKSGSVYRSVIWQEKNEADKLRVRGKVGPFGRTQVWNVIVVGDLPADIQNLNTHNWTPEIIK